MLEEKIAQGHHFKINFVTKSLRIDNKEIEKDKWLVNLESESILEKLQSLYDDYHFSRTSERCSYSFKDYFATLDSNELSDGELILGGDRYLKQFILEKFMLSVVVQKKWEEMFNPKHFFYKGNNGLVVLRDWFKEI